MFVESKAALTQVITVEEAGTHNSLLTKGYKV